MDPDTDKDLADAAEAARGVVATAAETAADTIHVAARTATTNIAAAAKQAKLLTALISAAVSLVVAGAWIATFTAARVTHDQMRQAIKDAVDVHVNAGPHPSVASRLQVIEAWILTHDARTKQEEEDRARWRWPPPATTGASPLVPGNRVGRNNPR